MAEQINVVIIDADQESRQFMMVALSEIQQIRMVTEAIDLAQGYELVKKNNPAIVILALAPTVDSALGLAEKITRNFPQIAIFATSAEATPEVIIKAMRAGAREFLAQPLNKDEFVTAVNSVIRLDSQRTAKKRQGGKILTIFGAKGGVGTTTIATNLAVNLAAHTEKSVILVDLNLQLGNAALFLNMRPEYSIVDVANHIDDLDPDLLNEVLPKHSSGVRLLSGPFRVEEAESIMGSHFDRILAVLKSAFEYIIIDTNSFLDEVILRVFDQSDTILTVSTSDLPALYNTRRCLDIFQRMGYGQDKVLFILNRCGSHDAIVLQEVEKSTNYPVYWKIPNQDYATVVSSINQGIPISIMSPRSKVSVCFKKLAGNFNGTVSDDQAGTEKGHGVRLMNKLFLRRSRSE